MILLLLLSPLILASLMPLLRKKLKTQCLLVLGYALLLACGAVYFTYNMCEFTSFFKVDDLNVLFILIMAVVLLGTAIYDMDFFARKEELANAKNIWKYHFFLLLFAASMLGVLLSANLGMLWVFLEASTLTSAMLVCYHPGRQSHEAAWKYIFICSIGISFAFIGIIFLSMSAVGTEHSLSWSLLNVHAQELNPFWLKMALPFLLIGFGAKMGLAPMHNWLPDAHSEAPAPISATLSAALLNAAFLGVLRVHKIMLLAGLKEYSQQLLIVMGFLSIFIPAVFIIRARNYKRMLAYSSVENMGIIAIGIGLGGIGVFAALLHMIGHSLIKSAFFLTSGNIYSIFHSKKIKDISNLLQDAPLSGWLWIFAAVGICAFPPFVTFASEFMIIRAMLQSGVVKLIIFCLLLTIILCGIFKYVLQMSFKNENIKTETPQVKFTPAAYLPQIFMLTTAVMLGVYIPAPLKHIIDNAVKFIGD